MQKRQSIIKKDASNELSVVAGFSRFSSLYPIKKVSHFTLKKSVKNDRVMIATRDLSRPVPSVAAIIKWPTVVIGDRMVSLMVCAVYSYDREDH